MKKFAIILGVVAVLAVLLIFGAPILLDPNKYKTKIQEEFEAKTGYELDISGDLALSVFPKIEVFARDVSISNGSKTLANVESISAYMELFPLFSGEYKIEAIDIVNPQIRLEKYENRDNWTKKESASGSSGKSSVSSEAPISAPSLNIDDIRITGGYVSYKDTVASTELEIKEINLSSRLASANGPFNFKGGLNYDGEQIEISGQVDDFADPKILLGFGAYNSAFGYEGGLNSGKINFQTPDVNKVLAQLPGKRISFPNPKGDFKGNVTFRDSQLEIDDLSFNFGSSKGVGYVTADLNGLLTIITADFEFDKLVAKELIPEITESVVVEAAGRNSSKHKTGPDAANNIYAVVNLDAKEVLYKKAIFKNFMLRTEIDGKEITIQPIGVEFPGGGKAELLGVISENSKKEKYFEGKIELQAEDLGEVLKGLEVDTSALRSEKLKDLKIDSQIFANFGEPVKIEFANTAAKFGESRFKGRFDIKLEETIKVAARGGIDKIDIDSILVPEKEAPKTHKAKKVKKLERKIDLSFLKEFPIDLNLAVAVGKLTFKGDRYTDVQGAALVKKGVADLQKFYFNSKKLEVTGKAKLNVTKNRPYINTDLTVTSINTNNFVQKDMASSPSKAPAKGEVRWSEEPYDLWPLDQIDADFKLRIESLSHDRFSFKASRIDGYLKDAKLGIEDLTTYGLGGKLNMTGNFNVGSIPAFNINYSGTDLDLYRVAKGFANLDRINGLATITGNAVSSGPNQKNMIKNLKGSTSIAGTNVFVKGFDLDSFASQITNINNTNGIVSLLRTVSSGEGSTLIKTLQGNVFTENGIAQVAGINLDAGYGQGVYKGYADLNKWYMDSTAEFKIVMEDSKERPPLGIRIFGAIDDPKKEVDTSAIRKYVTNRAARNLLKNDKIPEKYKGIVEGLIGGGINDTSGGAARQKSPEQNLIDLLKGF